jgi:hypothetical protein
MKDRRKPSLRTERSAKFAVPLSPRPSICPTSPRALRSRPSGNCSAAEKPAPKCEGCCRSMPGPSPRQQSYAVLALKFFRSQSVAHARHEAVDPGAWCISPEVDVTAVCPARLAGRMCRSKANSRTWQRRGQMEQPPSRQHSLGFRVSAVGGRRWTRRHRGD